MNTELKQRLLNMPLIAILRGLPPEVAVATVDVLANEGFQIAEVPLNRPDALEAIKRVSEAVGDRILTGAGTVCSVNDVNHVAEAGGKLIVSPNFNQCVVERTKELGLYSCPGVQTPSEAFAAIECGADALKLFPAEAIEPAVVKAMRAVLPTGIDLVPVGSIGPHNMADYWSAGANGFGLGLNLYKPGKSLEDIRLDARTFVNFARQLKQPGAAASRI